MATDHNYTDDGKEDTDAQVNERTPQTLQASVKQVRGGEGQDAEDGDLFSIGGVDGSDGQFSPTVSVIAGTDDVTIITVDLATAKELRTQIDAAIQQAEADAERWEDE